ncbi:zinc-ribbon domain-containing protein [Aliiroseovarius sp. S1339]|uniref:zinc-ribbon domain-containing protein n=1 Tax=Aliiroseovarius sp. S1339 TaxID=2936990 RepID=UPI0020BD7F60|nr:zinc-ribbon domain-containing protein [Aliiroseovarius sp. S1339]MCK8464493.1 zinc-ribbon domain-containing protein [Aliiroseovarius sp. S1339]
MRLVCPSCGAQYEVDDRVMPETGRDVQCSNCGHAWFQLAPNAEVSVEADVEASAEVDEVATPSPFDNIDEFDDEEADGDAPLETAPAEPDTSDEQAEDGEDDGEAPSLAARKLDDGVRSILQEEAERELKAREDDRENLETQPDLGLDEAPGAGPDATKRETSDEQATEQDEQPLTPDDIKRRDVLPDIEEINSTLDAPEGDTDGSTVDGVDGEVASPNGFRRGFILVVVLACLLTILYIFAPSIGERIPALQPAMEQFVELANRVRVGLEEMMRAAIGKMQGLIDKPDNG